MRVFWFCEYLYKVVGVCELEMYKGGRGRIEYGGVCKEWEDEGGGVF